jgi:hypothetical protein
LIRGKSKRERGEKLRAEEPVVPKPDGTAAETSKSSSRDLFVFSMSAAVTSLLVSTSFSKDVLRIKLEKQESARTVRELLKGSMFFSLFCELPFQLLVATKELSVCVWILCDRSARSAESTIETVRNVCWGEK